MLQHKDTHKISELKNGFTHRWFEADFILSSLTCFKLSMANKCFAGLKEKGYSLASKLEGDTMVFCKAIYKVIQKREWR
jgi:hypothetical protein